jgi:hypothetical protein
LAAHVVLTPRAGRRIACACALLAALSLAACGGDSSSSSGTNASAGTQQGQSGGRRGFFGLDAKTRACLQKQGVTLPTGRRPQNGQPPNGQAPPDGQAPPSGQSGSGQSGSGQRPNRPRFNRNSAQFQKLRAALQKCGVNFPNGGGGNGGAPPNQGTNTTSAS